MTDFNFFRFFFSFSGRESRKSFWTAYSILFAINILIAYQLSTLLGNRLQVSLNGNHSNTVFTVIYVIVYIILLVSRYALISRRFHDSGRSFMGFIGLIVVASLSRAIPVIGYFVTAGLLMVILVILCLPTDEDDEKYGPVRKVAKADAAEEISAENDQQVPDCTQLNGIILEPGDDDAESDGADSDK